MSNREVVAKPVKMRRTAYPIAIVLVVVFAAVGTMLRSTPTGVVFSVSDQVAMGLLGVLLAAGALLLTRPRLRADAEGLEVRNIIGTTRVPWNLVEGVSFPDGAPWARIELPDDEYVPIMAIQATDGQHAVVAMRELRELRRSIEV
ncbi:PH domain-containing protein [Saccharopolyspora halophila]|uniref:PH domain-containing protein n=1 Tax=Saccharopolyspora halophila TaxID=405551 RepID=A0ABN3G6G3_9PSEU